MSEKSLRQVSLKAQNLYAAHRSACAKRTRRVGDFELAHSSHVSAVQKSTVSAAEARPSQESAAAEGKGETPKDRLAQMATRLEVARTEGDTEINTSIATSEKHFRDNEAAYFVIGIIEAHLDGKTINVAEPLQLGEDMVPGTDPFQSQLW